MPVRGNTSLGGLSCRANQEKDLPSVRTESLRVPSAVGAVCAVLGTNAADVRTAAFPRCLMVRRQAAG